ncbi:MAG TPA: NAD/NADP octopine/nopaline dehydrogenase family protein [Pseudolysinimonas sp.]|jgi:opine dehydrogenase
MTNRSIAVIGGGNGALTVAGGAAIAGHHVRLWDRFLSDHPLLMQSGTITLRGAVEGEAQIEQPRDDLAWTIADAELIEIVVPGYALAWITSRLLPLVRPHQKVLLHPGGTGGALEVAQLWPADGALLGVTDTLAYATRLESETSVVVHAEKKHLAVAAAAPDRIDVLLDVVRDVHPQAAAAGSIREVALSNLNPIIHPPITLLNAGRIEAGQKFSLYGDGVGEGVGSLIAALDRERLSLAEALGLNSLSLESWVERAYGVAEPSMVELFARLDREVYGGLAAPTSLNSRYLTEDIPLGLEVFVELAAESHVDMPVTESVVRVARVLINKMEGP